jgi:hypothetical protein
MANPDDKVINGIPEAGQADYGQAIRFRLSYEGGDSQFFYCSANFFPKLLTGLNMAGGLAAKTRSAGPGGTLDLVTPVQMTKMTRTGQFVDGQIAIEFGTDMGFPMQLAMSRDLARRTIELLEAELLRPTPVKIDN